MRPFWASCMRIQSWARPYCLHFISEPKGADALLKSNEAYKLIFREYPDVVDVEQMCEMLGGINTKTAYRLLRQNQIKHFKIGRTYKIPNFIFSNTWRSRRRNPMRKTSFAPLQDILEPATLKPSMVGEYGHLREKNGYFQMILTYKDMNGKRQTKSVSTGLPVKGNKKRAEALLWKTRQEFNPDTAMSDKNALFAVFLNKWLQEVINRVDADTYALYAYDAKTYIIPYFKDTAITVAKIKPGDIEGYYQYERTEKTP